MGLAIVTFVVGVVIGVIFTLALRPKHSNQKLKVLTFKLQRARLALQASINRYKET